MKPFQFDKQIIHEWATVTGAGSLNFPDAPTKIEPSSLPDFWLRVALVGHEVTTIVLGESYSGSDIAIACCFEDEAPIIRCLANARAIVFDDELAAQM
ncbi:hypothetical protein [Phormidesmis sp. 146-33]